LAQLNTTPICTIKMARHFRVISILLNLLPDEPKNVDERIQILESK